ncbi:hypothetical protein [Candidatus Uabimicrobium sp. HlEnr_7]|uniref:hypothetical protein n=1 Tax=Candidatus Uabimicrobium helgolandensis TaxID=3095367 RepID=UPI003557EFEC
MRFYFLISVCIFLSCSSKKTCQFPQQNCDSVVTDSHENRTLLVKKMQSYLENNDYNREDICNIISEIDNIVEVIDVNDNINSWWVKDKLSFLRDQFPDRTTKKIFSTYVKIPFDRCLIASNCKIPSETLNAFKCYLCALNRVLCKQCNLEEIQCLCDETIEKQS